MAAEQPNLANQFHRTTGSYELVLGPVLFGLVGLFIDSRLDTRPLFLIGMTVFAIIGSAVSAYYRYRYEIDLLKAETADLKAKAEGCRE